ncbi:DUF2147 domain-containing protein [Aquimarina sp. MMG016]|uniref:DUF2147 domain-containing protein n=1 Tax=Aquimarina sp. MMG016 TaxID=2822690 RepID=UPI001B39DCB5|nr:DUF2147 domain-containing protein [Aquimarina sp. MMG016]MBQ4821668.1 DUF2147 domain-containing protein [Aquimarina sp. MMG016]
MKNILLIISLFVYSVATAQKSTDNFEGNWKMEEGFIVHIDKEEKIFRGTIVKKNKVILENIAFENNQWTATLIKPKDGKKVNCTLLLEGQKLKVIVKKGFVSKTLTWSKQL